MLRKSLRIGTTVVLGIAAAIASIAWAAPGAASDSADAGEASCRFAIRAENSLSFDVWVDLDESAVLNRNAFGVFARYKPLDMQQRRLRRGEKMDVRYTASGRCSAPRTWKFQVRTGSKPKLVFKQTEGADDRTVDLGRSSRW